MRLARVRLLPASLLACALSLVLGSTSLAAGAQLTLVAYSTPAAAYGQLIAAFNKTRAGNDVTFTQSYGASGDQSLAVQNGLHADIVNFSLEPDLGSLVGKHIVSPNWDRNPYHGFVSESTVVFIVRPGNPKHIHTWADLIKSGVDVITPNPFTSGGARWNIMAAYGAQLKMHKTKAQALQYLRHLFSHVSVQDKSARDELTTFASGKGDVMIDYQNDAIAAEQKNVPLTYVVPPQSILIENPIAVTTTTKFPTQAGAFLKFLWSKQGQKIWGVNGYWPVRADVAKTFFFKKPKTLFTIRSLGAWPAVQKQFFDPTTGVMAKIEQGKGVTP
jgi:sulfate/thiosulfate transport system substrate-binding protein